MQFLSCRIWELFCPLAVLEAGWQLLKLDDVVFREHCEVSRGAVRINSMNPDTMRSSQVKGIILEIVRRCLVKWMISNVFH